MGFDLTGMNPKNLHLQEPKRPDNLYELSEEKQKEYFDKQDEYTLYQKSKYLKLKRLIRALFYSNAIGYFQTHSYC